MDTIIGIYVSVVFAFSFIGFIAVLFVVLTYIEQRLKRRTTSIANGDGHELKAIVASQRIAFEDMRETYAAEAEERGEELRLLSNARIDAEKERDSLRTECDLLKSQLALTRCGTAPRAIAGEEKK